MTHDDEPAPQSWAVAFYRPMRAGDRWVPGVDAHCRRLGWDRLCEALTTFRSAPAKDQQPGWQPVSLSAPRRGMAQTVSVSCLVLDLDEGLDLEQLGGEGGPLASWPHIWHTTWGSSEGRPKARVVLPLETPCPARWFPRLWRYGQGLVGGAADEQAKDASRYYYLPCRGPAGDCRAGVWDPGGPLLDPRPWEGLPETPGEARARQARERIAARPRLAPWQGCEHQFARQLRQRALRDDPLTRAELGAALGGRVMEDRVTGVVCPACGRASVWWPLEPRGTPQGMCSHRSSCGWTGWLDRLEQGVV